PVLRSCRHTRIDLSGTASRTGTDKHNLELSERRAKVIRFFLQDKGVVLEQINYRGLGEVPARAAGKAAEAITDIGPASIPGRTPRHRPACPSVIASTKPPRKPASPPSPTRAS